MRRCCEGAATRSCTRSRCFRRDALLAVGGYREGCDPVEDLDLYLRLAERGRLANLPETLLRYRHHLRQDEQRARGRAPPDRERGAARRAPPPRSRASRAASSCRRLASETPAVDYWCEWVRQAVIGGNLATARKYAFAVLREQPGRLRSWQLLLRALLGLRVEPLKRWLAAPARRDERRGVAE